ncbi:hypothetical protein PInf_009345 [Phytophthora infestans]|nr:hypothetical protein PInf_009345 [Phytophthora infestans]
MGSHKGSFRTLAEGVEHLIDTSKQQTIFLFPGVYHEQVFITPLAGPLAKAQRDVPLNVTGDRNWATSTLGLAASSIKIFNLNVANTAGKIGGKVGQAVAVYANGTDYGFYACNFSSYRDTLCAHNGRELYARTLIQGATDFIFGMNAQAWFESCDIEVVGKGYVTANGRDTESNPSCQLSDVVHPEGWKRWNNDTNTDSIYYKEFNNSGPGAALDQRVSFSGQLNKAVTISDILGENYESEWWVDTKYL